MLLFLLNPFSLDLIHLLVELTKMFLQHRKAYLAFVALFLGLRGFLKEKHSRAIVLLHLLIKLYGLRSSLSKAVEMVIQVRLLREK